MRNITNPEMETPRVFVRLSQSKESWPKGPGFGLPLKGAVALKARQVKSA